MSVAFVFLIFQCCFAAGTDAVKQRWKNQAKTAYPPWQKATGVGMQTERKRSSKTSLTRLEDIKVWNRKSQKDLKAQIINVNTKRKISE